MFLLIALLVGLIILVYSYPNDDHLIGNQRTQEKIIFLLVGIVMIFFCGLRIKYNDTTGYIGNYNGGRWAYHLRDFIRYADKSLGANPGFHVLNTFMLHNRFDHHIFLFLYALFDVGVALWFIKKYARNMALGVLFFYLIGFFFMFAGIKQATSASMALIAIHGFFQGYWVVYGVFLFIAMTIHPYVVMVIVVPFFRYFRPWSWVTYVCIIVFGFIGVFLVEVSGFMSDMAQMMGDSFTEEEVLMGRGVNIYRFLSYFATIAMSFVLQRELFPAAAAGSQMTPQAIRGFRPLALLRRRSLKQWIKYIFQRHTPLRDDEIVNVYFHCSLLACSFMFMAIFGNQVLIGRLPHYLCAMRCLEMAYLFSFLYRNRKYRSLFHVCLFLYVAYFIFEYTINKDFSARYDCINLSQFFNSVWNAINPDYVVHAE